MGKSIAVAYDESAFDTIKNQFAVLEQIAAQLQETKFSDPMKDLSNTPDLVRDLTVVGPALRALNHFLNEADPQQNWNGLQETITNDGGILWLCPKHRELHVAKPLKVES